MDNTSLLDKIRSLLTPGTEKKKVVDDSVSTSNGEPVVVAVAEVEEESVFAEATLEDGTVVYFETLDVGSVIYTDDTQTEVLADGDYVIGDMNVTILEGVITEVTEATPVVEEEVVAEVQPEFTAEEFSAVKKENTDLLQKITDLEANLESVTTDKDVLQLFVDDLKKEVEDLNGEPLVEPVKQASPATRELTMLEKRMESLSSLRKIKKNTK